MNKIPHNICLIILLQIVFWSNPIFASATSSQKYNDSGGVPGKLLEQTVKYKGLEWQYQALSNGSYTWVAAKEYCNNLNLLGHSDWRLPTIDELKSLVKCSNGKQTPLPNYEADNTKNDPSIEIQRTTCCNNYPKCDNFARPTIDEQFVSASTAYWSSSLDENVNAWGVNFYDGRAIKGYFLTIPTHTRCVRDLKDQ